MKEGYSLPKVNNLDDNSGTLSANCFGVIISSSKVDTANTSMEGRLKEKRSMFAKRFRVNKTHFQSNSETTKKLLHRLFAKRNKNNVQ